MEDVPNILDITSSTYRINSLDGIEQWMTFVNKSTNKTIKYIKLEMEFYNAVGDVIENQIGGYKSARLTYTGPLEPGTSSGQIHWDAIFYNPTFNGTIHFKQIVIEYMDGTSITLDEYIADYAVTHFR